VTRSQSGTVGMFFRGDIMNILAAVDAAILNSVDVVDTPEMEAYRRGCEVTIRAMALAFGLSYTPRSQMSQRQRDALLADYVPLVKE